MSHPGKSFFSLEFVKFLASGGLAAAINYGSRFLYSQYFQFEIAVLLAYVTGMAFAFLLFKYFEI